MKIVGQKAAKKAAFITFFTVLFTMLVVLIGSFSISVATEHKYFDNFLFTQAGGEDGETAPQTFTIRFKNYNSLLAEYVVKSGDVPIYTGETPTRDNDSSYKYTFRLWKCNESGESFETLPKATKDATYIADFTAEPLYKSYKITFLNFDNTLLDESDWKEGVSLSYNGEKPTKPNVDGDIFEFANWKDVDTKIEYFPTYLPSVSKDTTYIALFNKKEKKAFDITAALQKFKDTTVVFDGKSHNIKIDEALLPNGVYVVEYSGGGKNAVGSHKITAKFGVFDPGEFLCPSDVSVTLTILPNLLVADLPNSDTATIKSPSGFPLASVLVVQEKTSNYLFYDNSLSLKEKVAASFSASLFLGGNAISSPKGEFQYKIPYPSDKEILRVLVTKDGQPSDVIFEREGDFIYFVSAEINDFAFIANSNAGTNIGLWLSVGLPLILLILAGLAYLVIKDLERKGFLMPWKRKPATSAVAPQNDLPHKPLVSSQNTSASGTAAAPKHTLIPRGTKKDATNKALQKQQRDEYALLMLKNMVEKTKTEKAKVEVSQATQEKQDATQTAPTAATQTATPAATQTQVEPTPPSDKNDTNEAIDDFKNATSREIEIPRPPFIIKQATIINTRPTRSKRKK